ncbi:MAG: flagellar motor switch protein FliN [Gammaproteobacteria bacterium]|nr:flagellar motor switch protein FliN [Gammaproteobacteria bacterium]
MNDATKTMSDAAGAGAAMAQGEDYARASFQNLQDDSSGSTMGDKSLDMILDIPVTVAVEIGRTKISISNLLKLNQGSVVELDRLAGEPMDVTVNGTLVAHGEVVVVNEKFGIRLTDIISATERVKKLK